MSRLTINLDRTLAAPPATVWAVLTDFPAYARWNPFCVACECDLAVGRPMVMTVNLTGRPQRQTEWVTEVLPGRGFTYGIRPVPLGALRSRRRHVIEPAPGGGTHYRSEFELQGWLVPIIRGLLGRKLEQGFTAMTDAVQAEAQRRT